MSNDKKEIRQYYDTMPEHIMQCMDMGDIETVREYLNGLIEARANHVISDYTSYKRMLELYQHANVGHGRDMAAMLTRASTIILKSDKDFQGSTRL